MLETLRLRAFFATLVLTLLPAVARAADDGWQDPATLSGLVGSYARAPLSSGPIAYVSFGGTDGYRAHGPYRRFALVDGILTLQTGIYDAIASNPAIGPVILFQDDDGTARDTWAIGGIRRDPLGNTITALQLIPMSVDGPPLILYRVGL
jgi:hypothetical protein